MSTTTDMHICSSVKINKVNNKLDFISFPPTRKEDTELNENIINAVVRSITYSSKICNYCELSNTTFSKDNTNIIMDYLAGSQNISNHHCYGCIQYDKTKQELFDQANMYFEYDMNIIQKHSLSEKSIKIPRSNGDTSNGIIVKDSCLRLLENNLMVYVEFTDNEQLNNKWVRFIDYKNGEKVTKGLFTLNPELKNEQLVLTIKNHPEWLNEYREPWKKIFEKEFNKININYKFEYED
jgi:hypothetical protein